ncbi:uncharacterized protein LOC129923053 [Biomphalaria glabrata]|uniref:Uncharacterized protein LOC129923053 n=1 Tax=Biomphalaria glabrata TaxID=6526 RepID=A0A9W2YYY4_BIOGL|nr:uncharacterized protein LOC129923053 [Biomphalaria glabrata]
MTLVVLVSLCAVLTLSYANPLNPRSCVIDGKTFKNGEIIPFLGSKCDTYNCVDGHPSLLKEGCNWQGECIPVKGTLVKNCKTYTCSKSTKGFTISLLKIGCNWQGECIPVKGTLVKNCKTYTCSKTREGRSISLLEIGCDFKNKCTPVKGTLVEDCITYTCFLYENRDERIANMSSTKIMCEDKDGICRNPGTKFKLVVNDKISDNCTCEIKENSIDYKCNGDTCLRREKPSV